METLLRALKIAIAAWSLLVAGNFVRVLIGAMMALRYRAEVETLAIRRARDLLVAGAASALVAATALYYGESLLAGRATAFCGIFLFSAGIAMQVLALAAMAATVAVLWGQGGQNRASVPVFRKLAGICFVLALAFWLAAWAIS